VPPYELFLMGYRRLKDEKLTFPAVTIRPVDYREKLGRSEKIGEEMVQANKIILEDID
jgi:hypothetical protein